MSWFSSFWNKAGPTVAAVAAVAVGQPELAIPASQAAAATIKKPKAPAPVQAPLAVGPGTSAGFVAAYDGLPAVDKEIVVIGGAVVGVALLFRLLAPRGRR